MRRCSPCRRLSRPPGTRQSGVRLTLRCTVCSPGFVQSALLVVESSPGRKGGPQGRISSDSHLLGTVGGQTGAGGTPPQTTAQGVGM